MITVSHDRPSHCDENDTFYTSFSRAKLAAKLGHDLRGAYDEMTVASQPDHLVELAGLIDARRRSEGYEG